MAIISSSLPHLLMAFGVQTAMATADLYSVLHTGSRIRRTLPMANCTSEYRYISDMHGWIFEPICFLIEPVIGSATTTISVFLRADLTCAVFQPLIYFSQVHTESQAVCDTGTWLSHGNGAISFFDFLGRFNYLGERYRAVYLDWKFILFVGFGLVIWAWLLYKVIMRMPLYLDLSRRKVPHFKFLLGNVYPTEKLTSNIFTSCVPRPSLPSR